MDYQHTHLPCSEIFNLMEDGILILFHGKIIFCNAPLSDWLGYKKNQLLNSDLSDYVTYDDQFFVSQILNINNQASKKINQVFFNMIHKDLKEKVTVMVNAIVLPSGDWAGHTLLTLRNATKEKMFQKLLNSSQQHLQEIVETFPDIYYVTDANGILIKVSPSVTKILGFEPQEVLGTPMSDYYVNPEFRDIILSNLIAGQGQYVRVEAPLKHKSGRAIWFNTRARTLLDNQGNITGIEGLARDASVEKNTQDIIKKRELELIEIKNNLELKIKQQTEELLQKERLWLQKSRHEQMGEMISSIAHQWRQPLNVLSIWINNFSSLFQSNNLNQEDVDLFTEKSNNLISSMSKTIDQFRGFFGPLASADIFNLSLGISEVLQLISPSLDEANIKLNFIIKAQAWVYGFSNEFGQVLINLLTNAKESFLEKKTESPQIEIVLFVKNDLAVLEISDNAGGIPNGIIDKIFDPYFTTKQKGTGIGLYMSKNIIERHMKGKIQVRNNSKGAQFVINLPISAHDTTIHSSIVTEFQQATPIPLTTSQSIQRLDYLRILFVDDNSEARTVIVMMLRKKGAEVKAASSVAEALQILSEFKPDIIISDILMPEEDGCSLMRKIRAMDNEYFQRVPAIALSAHVDAEEIKQAVSSGFTSYLTKPVDWKALMNLISELSNDQSY